MKDYQIFAGTTADYNLSVMSREDGEPTVKLIPMEVEIGGKNYMYGPEGNLTPEEFYKQQEAGNYATTAQINQRDYFDYFEPVLKEGTDILYLCFSSGLSGTYQAARLSVDELQEKYPERKIICIDTLCASIGEGLLICEAAQKKTEGMAIDDLANWVTENRSKINHWFVVDTLDHLRHGGRISATSAVLGGALNIKPLIHVDLEGKLTVMAKPRGQKKAVAALLEKMQNGWTPDFSTNVVIGHGDCLDRAEDLRATILEQFPKAQISIADIGPVIGAHTGPGTLMLAFWGNLR